MAGLLVIKTANDGNTTPADPNRYLDPLSALDNSGVDSASAKDGSSDQNYSSIMRNNIQMRAIISAMKLDSKDVELFKDEVCVTPIFLFQPLLLSTLHVHTA